MHNFRDTAQDTARINNKMCFDCLVDRVGLGNIELTWNVELWTKERKHENSGPPLVRCTEAAVKYMHYYFACLVQNLIDEWYSSDFHVYNF